MPAGVPVESLRLRFALLQSLNSTLETFFLPLVELRQTPVFTHSIAALLTEAKGQRRGPGRRRPAIACLQAAVGATPPPHTPPALHLTCRSPLEPQFTRDQLLYALKKMKRTWKKFR